MIQALVNIFKIEELRKKIFITLSLLIVYRVGCYIPTPGIDTLALSQYFSRLEKEGGQTLLGIMNLFTGGALTRLSIFALGIMPYISSSIIMQLLTAVVPALEKIAKEGKAGYEKINQYTRYLTLFLCVVQGLFLALWLSNDASFRGIRIVPDKGFLFIFTTILTLTAGTVFIMWLGEQIQERGIGNGMSLIITTGIISRIPISIQQLWLLYSPFDASKRQISTFTIVILLALWFIVIMGVILFAQGQRRIPIQHGKRIVGNRVSMGQTTYLPIRVDMAGVIAIIFAQSVIVAPATLATFLPAKIGFVRFLQSMMQERGIAYNLVYVALIMFFMYFYTAMTFNPVEISNHLKKSGGFIPGIRPGTPTSGYLDFVATRIVFVGAVYICAIAILPSVIMHFFRVPSYDIASFFGGTTLLILVGVVLDTMKQLEGQLFIRHYEGFIKGGSLRGRK
ncbi:MAG: preprotein translocase subunit SecY [Candidatus Omnitrophica bacterium]|nr:preprotein translocase subunit SecY [Candidatus Omnitrophota bacterium]